MVITDSINVDDSSGSKANVALISNLAAAGFNVDVYHYTLRDITLEGVKTFAIPEIKFSLQYFLSRSQRVLSRKFGIELARNLERIFGFSFTFFNDTRSIRKAIIGIKKEYDLVLTLSKGGSFRPHYAVLQLPQLHQKWLAYVHDPFPFHYYPRPYNWVEVSHLQKERFFRKVSQKARYSGFPSQLLMEWMGSYFEDFLQTGIIIPHQLADYKIHDPSFPDYFDPSKFNVLHAGNLMKQRSPKGLLDGFLEFLRRNPDAAADARLLLIGPADYHREWLAGYSQFSPQVHIVPSSISFDRIYHLQMQSCVNVILESKSEISPFLPAKFPHCISANKPILLLAPYYSEARRLLGQDYQFWSETDDVPRIAGLFERLYEVWKENPENLAMHREDIRDYLSASYLKSAIEKL
ncbi:UDP-glycosyltransferase [Flavobacterium magnum]|uniref:UDP-glycosyltransferase n=1 Tax=Flavobacterium magnum TaxID=2162713 RepID=A0A2S0RCV2_9FLAO|nr:UDP-glycosyltransferase [Flavobacterium magnum]